MSKKKNKQKHTELVPASPFKRYLYEANKYPLLSPEEESRIAHIYQETQDPAIAKTLVLSNLRLVVKIAMEYYYKLYASVTDLIQEGNLGLLMAVKKYDPNKGIRFPSYAQFWIRAYMLKYLLDSFSMVKIGTTKKQKKVFYNLSKAKDAIEKLGFKANPKLLAEYMNVREKDVKLIEQRMQNRDVSLDAPISEEDNKKSLQDFIVTEPKFEQAIEEIDIRKKIKKALDTFYLKLNEKEKIIWDRRLLAENKATLQELAVTFDISKERVRQIEKRITEKLKKYWIEEVPNISINDIFS